MNNNPIDELRHMQVPVSEQEWESIVSDKRYLKKFGQKSGMSPKGRAALICGVATILVAVPILVKTLTHKAPDTAIDNQAVTQVIESQTEAKNNVPATVSVEMQKPAAQHSEPASQMLPSASSTTAHAATQEQSTLATITEARVPASSQPSLTNTPEATTLATQPSGHTTTSHEKPANATLTENIKNRPVVSDNHPLTEDIIPEEYLPAEEKSQEEPVAEMSGFYIPSAFTPNGDGLNDLFQVSATFVPKSFELVIYNRRSNIVFRSSDINASWDGKLRGQTLPSGIYIYVITFLNQQGIQQQFRGQVMLLQ